MAETEEVVQKCGKFSGFLGLEPTQKNQKHDLNWLKMAWNALWTHQKLPLKPKSCPSYNKLYGPIQSSNWCLSIFDRLVEIHFDLFECSLFVWDFPCWRRPQTCHLWKLALGLYELQMSSDFNRWETLAHRVGNWPFMDLGWIYGRSDLGHKFGHKFSISSHDTASRRHDLGSL